MLGKIERSLKSIFVTKGRWYSLKSNSEIKLSLMKNYNLVCDSLTSHHSSIGPKKNNCVVRVTAEKTLGRVGR